ncbi:MAG: hypothetical protein QXD03_04445 [Candidatus Anstonellales archaeon]
MIGTVSVVEFTSNLRNLGNASMDYLSLEFVINTQRSLEYAIEEFITTFNPKKMYMGIKGINNNLVVPILDVRV